MLIPLPNLDDRRWTDLVEEGRALIPVYDPAWTDHNFHDPGMMMVELLAWLAEMDIYWLNRIPESRLLKFLALAGYYPAGPRPAQAVLQIALKDQADPVHLPAGMVFEGTDLGGQVLPFRSLHALTLAPGRLLALLHQEGARWFDLTSRQARGETLAPFGEDPQPGASFYLGFSAPLPVGEQVSLYFTLAGESASAAARRRLADWEADPARRCQAPHGLVSCRPQDGSAPGTSSIEPDPLLQHHSARLAWEYRDTSGRWRRLDAQSGQVRDGTRAFSLSGRVELCLPGQMSDQLTGPPQKLKKLFFLRCRLEGGAFDSAPWVTGLAFNGVLVEQAADLGVKSWMIAADAAISGPPPRRGAPAGFRADFDASGWIRSLEFVPGGPPGFTLLAYRPPQPGQPGQLSLQAEALKPGDGRPFQTRILASAPLQAESLVLYTLEGSRWVNWQAAADLDAAGRDGARFVLDPTSGELRFGDGERGRPLPSGARPLASYRATRAGGGNLPAGAIQRLADCPLNRALAGSLHTFTARIASITNPLPAGGGAPAETVEEAVARMRTELARPAQAVTLEDIQVLARETPGVRLARAAAIPNLHPAYPCMQAPGVVTVIVLPDLPAGRPQPSPGLLNAVRAYLALRRVVGTRMVVVGPQYIPVTVRAKVRAHAGVDRVELPARIAAALERFFHPLVGGPEGGGWPFGRDVYRSEVLQRIDEISGVDHVRTMELIGADGEPSCGNLCLGRLGLPAAGPAEIEVV